MSVLNNDGKKFLSTGLEVRPISDGEATDLAKAQDGFQADVPGTQIQAHQRAAQMSTEFLRTEVALAVVRQNVEVDVPGKGIQQAQMASAFRLITQQLNTLQASVAELKAQIAESKKS